MPKALCFKCGAIKNDAWAPCDECHTTPQAEIDLATSLALTEDHFGVGTLQSFGSIIRGGQRPQLSPETRAAFLDIVRDSTQHTAAPEIAFEAKPILRFQPTGIQMFFKCLFSLVGLEFIIAFAAIDCTLARSLMDLSEETSTILLWSAIALSVLGALVMPVLAWRFPNAVPSFRWFLIGAYLAGFGAPLAFTLASYFG